MNKLLLFIVLGTILFSCNTEPARPVLNPPLATIAESPPREYTIIDHKNNGEPIPEWVSIWLSGGNSGVETISTYEDLFVFVHSSEGNNFRALELWRDSFNSELDFPRLAARRIEARFGRNVPFPDMQYGPYYEALVRASSDAYWTGSRVRDNFWIQKKYLPSEEEGESESWEFLILVTIEKSLFDSQLEAVFKEISDLSSLTKDQTEAVKQVQDHFFDRF